MLYLWTVKACVDGRRVELHRLFGHHHFHKLYKETHNAKVLIKLTRSNKHIVSATPKCYILFRVTWVWKLFQHSAQLDHNVAEWWWINFRSCCRLELHSLLYAFNWNLALLLKLSFNGIKQSVTMLRCYIKLGMNELQGNMKSVKV